MSPSTGHLLARLLADGGVHEEILEDLENHIDIADWLIRWKTQPPCEPVKKHCVAFLKAAKFIDPEYHEQLEALIEEIDLELWRVERIEKEAAQEPS